MQADTTYLGCVMVDLSSDLGAAGSFPESVIGVRSGAELGADLCLLVNFEVGRRWRGGKPRGYLPLGTADDLETRQTWTSAFLSDVETPVQDLYSQMEGSTFGGCTCVQQVNVSYYGPPNRLITGSTGRVRNVSTVRGATGSPYTGPAVDNITAVTFNPRLGSQRRRNQIRS
jgi:hypothetical protein